jgi:hypothetical protein
MIILGLCPRCGEARVRSTIELEPGNQLDPNDFEGIGDHPAPEPDQPMACADCGTTLVFRRDPTSAPPPPLTHTNGHHPADAAVTTLFAAELGEEVVTMRALTDTRYLIQTTRRLLVVDLVAFLPPGSMPP